MVHPSHDGVVDFFLAADVEIFALEELGQLGFGELEEFLLVGDLGEVPLGELPRCFDEVGASMGIGKVANS